METIVNSNIEDLKTNLENRERALEESHSKHKGLEVKLAELQANLHGLKTAVQEAETRKVKALDSYALDETKLPQLEKSRGVCELAKRTECEAEELLGAVEKALMPSQKRVADLGGLVQGAKYKLWFAISEELAGGAKERVGSIVEQAWQAKLNAGGTSYDAFLLTVFPQPGIERMQEIQKEMGA